jgi:hypothetical protein
MPIYIGALLAGIVGVLASFVWCSLVDGTIKREPSEWVGHAYLGLLLIGMVWASKYLDQIRAHPYQSSAVAFVILAFLGRVSNHDVAEGRQMG